MTKDEAILKIKDQLKKLVAFSTTPNTTSATPVADDTTNVKAFTNIKLKDGSEISILDGTELNVGTEIYTIDKDGNQTPCEDGSYDLEDGRTIVVTGGVVETIGDTTPADQTESTDETPENPAQLSADAGETPEAEAAEADRITALENQVAQILEILQGMSNMQEQVMSKVKEIGEEPAVESIKLGKTISTNLSSMKSEMDELKSIKSKMKFNGSGNFTAASAK
jgi:hypothetical protein